MGFKRFKKISHNLLVTCSLILLCQHPRGYIASIDVSHDCSDVCNYGIWYIKDSHELPAQRKHWISIMLVSTLPRKYNFVH